MPASKSQQGVRRADVPLFRQIGAILREQAADGRLKPGDRIESEPELCAMFGVSRVTVRRALDLLERDGLIERTPGRGTFLRAPQRQASKPATPWRAAIAELERRESVLLRRGEGPAPDAVRAAFGLGAGAELEFDIRIFAQKNAPRVAVKRYFRPGLAAPPAGCKLGAAWCEALLAEPRFAMMLKTPAGSALMSLWWIETARGKAAVVNQMIQAGAARSIGISPDDL